MMFDSVLATLSQSSWEALVTATGMLSLAGIAIALILPIVSMQSWRLRSWLVAAVLLQGMMIYRSPVHLGWIESNTSLSQVIATEDMWSRDWSAPISTAGESPNSAEGGLFSNPSTPNQDFGLWHHVWGLPWASIAFVGWFVVVLTLVFRSLTRYVRLVRLVKQLESAPRAWQSEWQSLLAHSQRPGAAKGCRMLVSETVGPLLVRCPKGYALIIPTSYWQRLSDEQRRGVMLHELAHLERRDVWRQLAARMIAAIHWFNPIAWWALRKYEQTSEFACDQRVADQGKRAVAGFASALLELVQWHQQREPAETVRGGIGFQAMAAPPLSSRISRLLNSPSVGDSLMKRTFLALMAIGLVAVSFFQIRLTTAQENHESNAAGELRVLSPSMQNELEELAESLDREDPVTSRLAGLIDAPEGEIAIAGMLNQLAGEARHEARADAVPRFFEAHFQSSDDSGLTIRPEHVEAKQRWIAASRRLAVSLQKMKSTTDDLATQMDTSTDAGGLLQRLMKDPQAPAAILLFEMENGGDVIGRFIAEAMERMLVERGDGTFQIVDSRREEAESQVGRFELACQISDKLRRQFPVWAAEFDTSDERHERLASYMKDPLMATVVSLAITDDKDATTASAVVDELFEQLEELSDETPRGLTITKEQAWTHFEEMFEHVDRAREVLPRVQRRLAELAETLSMEDPLAKRLAAQLKQEAVAVLVSAELPYAESDPGDQLRALLSEVLTENEKGKLQVNPQQEQEVLEKAKELLQVCRAIRRHVIDVDESLERIADREFVEQIGEPGRYLLLSEIRRFAERHQPQPFQLMMDRLLTQSDDGRFRVREDRREVVRELVEQSEKIRQEADNDDF